MAVNRKPAFGHEMGGGSMGACSSVAGGGWMVYPENAPRGAHCELATGI